MTKLQKSSIEISVLNVIWKERKDGIIIVTIIISSSNGNRTEWSTIQGVIGRVI